MAGKVCSVLLVPGHDWDTNCNVEFYFISLGNPNPVGGGNGVRAPVPVRDVDDQAQQAQQRPRSPIQGGYQHNTNELVAGRLNDCSQPQSLEN